MSCSFLDSLFSYREGQDGWPYRRMVIKEEKNNFKNATPQDGSAMLHFVLLRR